MFGGSEENVYLCTRKSGNPGAFLYMVPVVQLVRASDCGSECRGFESHRAPSKRHRLNDVSFFVFIIHTTILSGVRTTFYDVFYTFQ